MSKSVRAFAFLYLSHGERSDCEAIRVRGYKLESHLPPHPNPLPVEVGYIRLRPLKISELG